MFYFFLEKEAVLGQCGESWFRLGRDLNPWRLPKLNWPRPWVTWKLMLLWGEQWNRGLWGVF